MSAESGDDLLGLGLATGPLAGEFAGTVEDLADDEDLLAYEPGMAEDIISLVGTEPTVSGFTEEELETLRGEDEGLTTGTGRSDEGGLGKGM